MLIEVMFLFTMEFNHGTATSRGGIPWISMLLACLLSLVDKSHVWDVSQRETLLSTVGY
jgi:hypothetical protein